MYGEEGLTRLCLPGGAAVANAGVALCVCRSSQHLGRTLEDPLFKEF